MGKHESSSLATTVSRSVSLRLLLAVATLLAISPLACHREASSPNVGRLDDPVRTSVTQTSSDSEPGDFVGWRSSLFNTEDLYPDFVADSLASVGSRSEFAIFSGAEDGSSNDQATGGEHLSSKLADEVLKRAEQKLFKATYSFLNPQRVIEQLKRASPLRHSGSRALTKAAVRTSSKLFLVGMVINYSAAAGGLQSFEDANRVALATGIGAVAGVGFTSAVVTLVTAYGAASTGTAIAGLSGAAASSATLAWLGGGSVAAGGFGTLGGSIVLTGGAVLVVAVVAGAVMVGFESWDDTERLNLTRMRLESLEKLSK